MTQGKPVSLTEKRKIWEFHQAGYFPSQIALHLSRNYAEENGGYRSTETVKDTIKMLEKREELMGAAVPEELPDLSEKGEPVAAQIEPAPVAPKRKLPDMRKGNGRKK